MSNILDALKEPGQAGEPAGPGRLHRSFPLKALKSGARRYLPVFALILSAWLLFWQPGVGQAGENRLSVAGNTGETPAMPARSHSAARRAAMGEMYGRLPPQYFTRFNSQGAAANAGKSEAPKWQESTGAGNSPDLSAHRAPDGKGAEQPESGGAGQAVKFQDIPSRIRDSIPITISMLSYSKRPGDSWVNLNGSKMHEGELMDSGPKVEAITPDGVIFSYQGHNFYKGIKDD